MLDRLSGSVRDATVRDIVRATERFARREPLLFLGGAFTLGLFAARFLKSSEPDPGNNGRLLMVTPTMDNVPERSVGELFNELATETSTLVRQEVRLATSELAQKAAHAGRYSQRIAVGAAMALVGLMTLAGAIVLIPLSRPSAVGLSADRLCDPRSRRLRVCALGYRCHQARRSAAHGNHRLIEGRPAMDEKPGALTKPKSRPNGASYSAQQRAEIARTWTR